MDLLLEIASETWAVTTRMAPYLLFGFLVAGMLTIWISPAWMERHLGGSGFGPVLKASLFGVPLPLCSCGVIPVAAGLRRHGATRAATASFLVSTPQTGVDSILATYAMFGPLLAVYRPVVALVSGFLVGGLVEGLDGGERQPTTSTKSDHEADAVREESLVRRLRRGIRYGLVTLPRDIAGALVVGLIIAGLLSSVVPDDLIARHLGTGIGAMLLLMATGVPLYVCATASVPIAASFLTLGASPGAVLAFLVVGPATNTAAIAAVWKFLGRKTAIIYLASVVGTALGAGLLLDGLVPWAVAQNPDLAPGCHVTETGGWLYQLSGAGLLVVIAYSWWERRRRASRETSDATATDREGSEVAPGSATSQRVTLIVEGMNCSHCQETVQRALQELDGAQRAVVDLESGEAIVEGSGLDAAAAVQAVEALGYRPRRMPSRETDDSPPV